jgi:hypothetical protein
MSTSACLLQSSLRLNWKRMAEMFNRRSLLKLGSVAVLSFMCQAGANADTLKQITSSSAQASNDALAWSQKGADGTVLAASFTATTAMSNSVTVGMGAANSIVSVVCAATPCSWTGTGFTAGHSLLWSSDAGNGGSGPATLTFSKSISGAGALVQADLPGPFTGEIQVYNGTTLLATYTVSSDTAGDPVYLGALDESGPNINKVVFSLTACASLCTDFGVDTVNVNAATAAPAVTLTPTSLKFASTAVGSTTAAQVVTVKNSGTATLNLTSETITGTNTTSFIKSATTCGTTLAAAATCTVSVEFKPATAGPLSASLSIADNASGSPQAVALTGTGTAASAPAVSLTPASIAFPASIVGTTTTAQVVTLKNTGTATLTISSIALGGANPTSFVEIGTCGSSLAAGASCSLYVGFKPASAAALSATLSVTDNAAGSPHKVTLTGTGTAAPTMKLSTTSITFPTTLHATTSASSTITLTNVGTSTMTLSSITLAGTNPTDFVELNTCGATLAPAATCSVYVAFKPAAAGSFKATLIITDNGAASPQSVALAGTGN